MQLERSRVGIDTQQAGTIFEKDQEKVTLQCYLIYDPLKIDVAFD